MTAIPSYFTDFLDNVRLTPELRTECERVHTVLRGKLAAAADIKPIYIGDFLQGSYRRHTGVKPSNGDGHVDVDLVVVTSMSIQQYPRPDQVVARFQPFLDREYPNQWERNDRSMKITPRGAEVTIDLVVTSAPSEMEEEVIRKALREPGRFEAKGEAGELRLTEAFKSLQKSSAALETWQREPLLIPARDLQRWVPTHPLEQIRWTIAKGDRTNTHFVNVVKAIKWWRRRNPAGVYPKGYPLEHLVGLACPDSIGSVAEGVVLTLESIRDVYIAYASSGRVPELHDHGVPSNNVFKNITPEQFRTFWGLVDRAAGDARRALDAVTVAESAVAWRAMLGPEFPEPPKGTGFVPPSDRARPTSGGRFG